MKFFACLVLTLSLFLNECSQGVQDISSNTASAQIFPISQLSQTSPIQNMKQSLEEPLKITKPSEVFEIKGISAKLTEKEKNSIDKWKLEITQTISNNQGTAFLNGNTPKKLVALTFDDGPDQVVTPKILDILKHNQVHGNFFFIGSSVKLFPSVVKKAYDEGNLVLSHGFEHSNFTNKTESFICDEFNNTNNAICSIIGKTPVIVRPPYGIINENVLNAAKSQGYKLVIWSTDTFDWSQKDKSNIVDNVINNVRPGEIILMHSNGDKISTAEALPLIIEGLQEKGYTIVTLDLLLNTNAYK
ncbi:MAG TPA: polysaccharide deacetylase family protein [Desulfitobacteriaceae bacterium]|nr:polysaccharide deacetylase family protein [Desulfitobacteriaceae bacterium]